MLYAHSKFLKSFQEVCTYQIPEPFDSDTSKVKLHYSLNQMLWNSMQVAYELPSDRYLLVAD
jgi:hypothetical protein